ncbi:MAG: ATP synthase F1 subunit gamma [Patescibacteria group bacterium]
MESVQHIKRRIQGIDNINQITKAMELVAANKMRRSQEIAIASRPYAFATLDLLANISKIREGGELPALLLKRGIKKTAIILVTSDKGLAGSFNSTVIRQFEKFIRKRDIDMHDPQYIFLAVGQKAAAYLERRVGLAKKFVRVGDYTTLAEVEPIAQTVLEGYLTGKWDEVIIFSMHFRTALHQEILTRRILPVDFEALREAAIEVIPQHGRFSELVQEKQVSFFNREKTEDYLIEPSPAEVLDKLARHLVVMQIYHLILEANASEHAARRMAMKSASDNAEELAEDLTLVYNKSRQAAITKEIVEITAGAEALRN